MKILIECEFYGVVRDAFIAHGHDAISCDILPTESVGPHIQGDVREFLGNGWDLMIAHPPCTYLAVCGARWIKERNRQEDQEKALQFVLDLMKAPIEMIAIENPVGVISSRIRRPNQYIQPYLFGHDETKKTGLWLKNLPPLLATRYIDPVGGRNQRIWKAPPLAIDRKIGAEHTKG